VYHVVSSRRMREASVHTEPTRDETPTVGDRPSDDQHRRDRRARLEEKVRRGYHSEAAVNSQGNPCKSTSDCFQSSAPRCPTSPTRMSLGHSSPAPLAETW
jgi:hypothetical protein